MLHHPEGRRVHELAVQAVLAEQEAGHDADGIADREALHVLSERLDGAGRLVADDGREGRLSHVLAGPEHDLGPVEGPSP